ncbi:MAG: DUF192 domain-containing protein [candidate division WOR-3 bacterium]
MATLINISKNTIISNKAIVGDTFFKRLKGWLGRKNFNWGESLIIRPCKWIHTFFMRFPVDVIFVNAENKIVAMKSCFKPWRISGIYWRARFVIELPCGTIKRTSTTIGDIIELI